MYYILVLSLCNICILVYKFLNNDHLSGKHCYIYFCSLIPHPYIMNYKFERLWESLFTKMKWIAQIICSWMNLGKNLQRSKPLEKKSALNDIQFVNSQFYPQLNVVEAPMQKWKQWKSTWCCSHTQSFHFIPALRFMKFEYQIYPLNWKLYWYCRSNIQSSSNVPQVFQKHQ